MIYHVLPVIPEDDVLVLSYTYSNHHQHHHHHHSLSRNHHDGHDNKNHTNGSTRTRFSLYDTTDSHHQYHHHDTHNRHNTMIEELSPFGYIAILRNDIILLEIGRSSFDTEYHQQNHVGTNIHRGGMDGFCCNDDDPDEDDDDDAAALYIDPTIALLDQTIHGLLQQMPSPGWETFSCNAYDDDTTTHSRTSSDDNEWIGLRFHCYDDDCDSNNNNNYDTCETNDIRRKQTSTIWSFCVVYHRANISQEQPPPPLPPLHVLPVVADVIIQQWVIEHMVQFTKLFRPNDKIWKTGNTLSCQYVFAPAIQQRLPMMVQQQDHYYPPPPQHHHQQQQPTKEEDDTLSPVSSSNWMDIANDIIQQNHIIIAMQYPTLTTTTTTTTVSTAVYDNRTTDATPFVSDESDSDDDDDDDDLHHQSMNDTEEDPPDYDTTTSSDDETEDDDDELFSPVRTGALPINYYNNPNCNFYINNDDNTTGSYIDRIVASTASIWIKQSIYPIVTSLSSTTPSESSFILKDPTNPGSNNHPHSKVNGSSETESDTDDDDMIVDDMMNQTNKDQDEETIPLICFVNDQVDAQHSDLWQRSPKCITKSVALGITTVVSPKIQKQQQQLSPTTGIPVKTTKIQSISSTTAKAVATNNNHAQLITLATNTNPLEILVQRMTASFDSFWNKLTHQFNDDDVNIKDENQTTSTNKIAERKCFWCESVFPSKVSAIV